MSFLPSIDNDIQFMRLVRRESDVDLVTAALEIARDSQSDLSFEPTLTRLRKSIARLTHPVTQAGSDLEELKLLIRHMTEELNLHGDDDCYEVAECSYVNRVLETGRGIPISLSLIYLFVANNLGIPLEPIAAPAHFLTRLPTDHGNLYVDAFDSGRIMDEEECVSWLHDLTELPISEIRVTLKPVDERTILIRMLNNLKSIFGNREQWTPAWRVQHRLSLLIPGSYRERRDLAIISLRAGRSGEAISLLKRCIQVCPPDERSMLQQHLKMAEREAPLWN
ncbi:MAG: tetratricopeptide repeat protein [Planctomycetaceae bacterium]|nr:tetratricopeptide repeat protein [Planctomycetaceae bacterium]